MQSVNQWRHVFKLDPAKEIDDDSLEKVCESGTDAIMVGGSTGVTFDNTVRLLSRVRRFAVPCCLEVSQLDAVVPGFDLYLVPVVLNAGSPEWIIGSHVRGLKEYGPFVPWEQVMVEGYVVLNDDSSVAGVTESRHPGGLKDVKAYAQLADRLLKLPIFYMEYSGTYGDPEWVKEVKKTLTDSRLFYGGGIKNAEQAEEMAHYADTVVVGNIIYEDVNQALQTVEGVKSAGTPL